MNKPTTAVRDRVSEAEWRVRVDLAACYRLAALNGWDDLVFGHITARVPDSEGDFFINAFGLSFDEITASNLVRITKEGEIVEDPTGLGYNHAGFVIHGALHEARPEVQAVVHLHPPAGVAVSCQADGLLPLNQQSMTLDVGYHEFEGLALDMPERERLAANLGDRDLLILRNHGLVSCGRSVGNAFLNMYELSRACSLQLMAQSGGAKLHFPSKAVHDRLLKQIEPPWDLTHLTERLAWPALLRKLDRLDASYKD